MPGVHKMNKEATGQGSSEQGRRGRGLTVAGIFQELGEQGHTSDFALILIYPFLALPTEPFKASLPCQFSEASHWCTVSDASGGDEGVSQAQILCAQGQCQKGLGSFCVELKENPSSPILSTSGQKQGSES